MCSDSHGLVTSRASGSWPSAATPAVDGHHRAGDEARLVGQEQVDHGGDLLSAADAAERMEPPQRSVKFAVVALGHDRAERDGVDADAARPVVDGQSPGEPSIAALAVA